MSHVENIGEESGYSELQRAATIVACGMVLSSVVLLVGAFVLLALVGLIG